MDLDLKDKEIKRKPLEKLDEWIDPETNELMIYNGKEFVWSKNTTITCEQLRIRRRKKNDNKKKLQ